MKVNYRYPRERFLVRSRRRWTTWNLGHVEAAAGGDDDGSENAITEEFL